MLFVQLLPDSGKDALFVGVFALCIVRALRAAMPIGLDVLEHPAVLGIHFVPLHKATSVKNVRM